MTFIHEMILQIKIKKLFEEVDKNQVSEKKIAHKKDKARNKH